MEDVWNKWRRNFLVLSKLKCTPQEIISREIIAWENSRHLATRETSAQMPYCWRVSTQISIQVVPRSDWLKQISHSARPIKSTTQIWVVTGHQYEISACASFSDVISRGNQLVVEVVESWNVACFLRSREIRLHLTFSVNWNKSDSFWKKREFFFDNINNHFICTLH